MKPLITKAAAQAFKERWELVNTIELEELQKTSPASKLQQLTTLMTWVKDFGWGNALKEGETDVRERWLKLKRIYRG